jgi:predicted ribosomally synthesized peptide with SipW-like signal peptide
MSRHTHPRNRGVGRFTRLRVLLAAGLVLGVGASVTLASWNDEERANASFTAGMFGIEGSATGTTFTDYSSTATAAALSFSLPPKAMVPGSVLYALYSVRTSTTSIAGTVVLAADAANSAGLGAHLTYGVRSITGTTCSAAAYGKGAVVVPNGSSLSAGQAAPATLPLAAAGASPVNYCFEVTLPQSTGNEAQGKTAAVGWTFNAVSAAP